MGYEPFTWGDEGSQHNTQQEFRHNWQAMPPRDIWNADPLRKTCNTCPHCGYRWDQVDFTYRDGSGMTVDGRFQLNPSALHTICWNCWMVEKQPEKVQKYWDAADRPAVGSTSKKTAELKPLGGVR